MDFAFTYNIHKNLKRVIDNNFKLLKYFEYLENLKKQVKELSDSYFASFSYIPVMGWVLPLLMRKGNSFCEYHAKQGFIFSVIFIVIAISLNLINVFTPREWREVRLALVIIIYIVYLGYLIFSFAAIRAVLKGKPFNIDIVKRLADLIEL